MDTPNDSEAESANQLQEKISLLERRLAEAEEDRRILQALMDQIPEGISIIDACGKLKYISRFGAAMGGETRANLEGRAFEEAFGTWDVRYLDEHTPARPEDFRILEALHSGKVIEDVQVVINTGELKNLQISFRPISDENGKYSWGVISWQDITAQKMAREELQSLAKFPGENPFPVLRIAADGLLLYANPASRELLSAWGCAVNCYVPEQVLQFVLECLQEGAIRNVALSVGGKTFAAAFTPIVDRGYANLYAFDITEQIQVEQELRKLSRAVEQSSATVVITDVNGRIEYANPKFTQLTGYSLEEALGKTPSILKSGLTPPHVYQDLWTTIKAGGQWRGEFCNRKKNGELYWENASISPLTNEQGVITHFIAVKEDVTDRKQAEEALRLSEKRLIDILESTHDKFFALDHNWRIQYANQRFIRRIGVNTEDLIGKSFWEVFPNLLGTEVEANFRRVKEEGKPVQFQTGNFYASFWYEISAFPTQDGLAVFAIDRTEQHKAEEALRESEAVLRTYAEKLERSNRDLQEFAFVASHDLQEPLRKIASFAEVLLSTSENLDERQRGYLDRLCQASERMRKMIDDLLELSRVATQGQPYARVELSKVAAHVISDLELQIERTGGTVEVGDLPVVEADPLQIRRLFQNLISNALKYHRPDVPPVVKVSGTQLSPELIQIRVEDNGIGFDENQVERIFQPFQRLVGKSQFEGTGMGLAICKRIVERHGGELIARSTPGVGSTFIITLPA